MSKMTTAERRGYQQICGENGAMMVIACDQRGGMRTLLSSDEAVRANISDADLGVVKGDIVRYLANHASSVLLDPTCAVPGVVDEAILARDVALIIGLDASGFDTDAHGFRLSRLAKGITARKVRELGGTAGKIMVYLRADRPGADDHNIAILKHCIEDFAKEDLLLVVEFLTYDWSKWERKFVSIAGQRYSNCPSLEQQCHVRVLQRWLAMCLGLFCPPALTTRHSCSKSR